MTLATSAFADLIPRLDPYYSALGECHKPRSPQSSCSGCQLAAEATFLAALRAWEWFVHNAIIDLMVAAPTMHRLDAPPARVGRFSNRVDAEQELLKCNFDNSRPGRIRLQPNPKRFIVLHNPALVSAICGYFGSNTKMQAVFDSAGTDIARILSIRHGIAHGTDDAIREMQGTLRHYQPTRAFASAGEFLLSTESITTSERFLDILLQQIFDYAHQISP